MFIVQSKELLKILSRALKRWANVSAEFGHFANQSFIPIRLHAAEIQARAHPVLRCNEGQTPKTLPQWHSHTQSHSLKHQKHCSGLKQSSLVQCHTWWNSKCSAPAKAADNQVLISSIENAHSSICWRRDAAEIGNLHRISTDIQKSWEPIKTGPSKCHWRIVYLYWYLYVLYLYVCVCVLCFSSLPAQASPCQENAAAGRQWQMLHVVRSSSRVKCRIEGIGWSLFQAEWLWSFRSTCDIGCVTMFLNKIRGYHWAP